jgi:redox-sensitive bicupin YhaK (pirin superfamily)
MHEHIFHQANTRGEANHGWLKSFHTFSFGSYYHPERINFGVLRVLNDDTVTGGMGFGAHPHDNMEIISIPLRGNLIHEDSLGHKSIIKKGDIQVMSAGSGISHSEYNQSKSEPVAFLQIWVYPNKRNVPSRYQQISLLEAERKNKLQQILSPEPDGEGVWIHQDAWFHLGNFDRGTSTTYSLKKAGNGVYAFILKGTFQVDHREIGPRDGLGITGAERIHLVAGEDDAEILIMEVPMLQD